eukprot:8230227-Pyramimonas_sp.AAC.1
MRVASSHARWACALGPDRAGPGSSTLNTSCSRTSPKLKSPTTATARAAGAAWAQAKSARICWRSRVRTSAVRP